MPLPRLLLVEHHTHRRLALIDRLRDTFSAEGVPVGLDPLRTIRAAQPDMVLIVVYPLRPARASQVCRWLKTDVRPVHRVAMVNLNGPPRPPDLVMERDRADGYYEGPEDLEAILDFTREVWAGHRPVRILPRPGWMWRCALGR